MFCQCLAVTITARKPASQAMRGSSRRSAKPGELMMAASAASEEKRNRAAASSQTAQKISPSGQWTASSTPSAVATPLPPRKRSQTVAIWPTTAPARVQELFTRYPALWGELSYRSGISNGQGRLSEDWRALFAAHSDRFLLGSDTWINERWFGYDTIVQNYRAWLVQLPADQARRIASGNAERLFGPRRAE